MEANPRDDRSCFRGLYRLWRSILYVYVWAGDCHSDGCLLLSTPWMSSALTSLGLFLTCPQAQVPGCEERRLRGAGGVTPIQDLLSLFFKSGILSSTQLAGKGAPDLSHRTIEYADHSGRYCHVCACLNLFFFKESVYASN